MLGNVTLACLLIAVSLLPPNQRLQLTPLRVERDQGDFEIQIGLNCFPIYRCGATEAQHVGWQRINARPTG